MTNRNFDEWLSKFRPSISSYDYYIDFEKVIKNVDEIKVELNILNSLIGSKNIEDEFEKVVTRYPETLKCIPLLLAVRRNEIYAQEYSIARNEKITLSVLNEAAKRFYNERLSLFFEEGKTAQMTYDERVEIFQLRTLMLDIIQREKDIKTSIRTNKYSAKIFDSERTNPYTSHFYISKKIEHILGTLELNFFVNKYNEMSSKNGEKVSIYALNYGLCLNENLRWGKPDGSESRTYFIESPFNFNKLLMDFLKDTKEIVCEECGFVYSEDDLDFLKRHNMNCQCGGKNSIVVKKRISDIYRKEIEEIEKKGNLLEKEQYLFMKLAILKGGCVTAREMSQEMDITSQKIGWLTKKLEEDFYYLTKSKKSGNTVYTISDLGEKAI